MEKIERETEIHRTQKAVKAVLGAHYPGHILLPSSDVSIAICRETASTPGGQLALTTLVNQLARMKSIISSVSLPLPYGIGRHINVPLVENDLRAGLEILISSMSGPESEFQVAFDFDATRFSRTVNLAIGRESVSLQPVHVLIEADSWGVYINHSEDHSDWENAFPIGPMMAATFGVAELFKCLMLINFPDKMAGRSRLLNEFSFSPLTFGVPEPSRYPALKDGVQLSNVAIAGVGAGGSTVVYVLGSLPALRGDILLIDPGRHKNSSLGRYLLSSYDDCARGSSKAASALDFLVAQQPSLRVRYAEDHYEDLPDRKFDLVVSTTDTPEARWLLQHDWPSVILDGAVIGSIYATLRVERGRDGMCLGCKHPYDQDIALKRRAKAWGVPLEEMRTLSLSEAPVTWKRVNTMAAVQGRTPDFYSDLVGKSFYQVPSLTECGDVTLPVQAPNQVATLPFVTTMAGLVLSSELIKNHAAPDSVLNNWFEHDMFWFPKIASHEHRLPLASCHICAPRP